MANYQNSQDLVQAVLSVCGELTDGTSGYQADALTYLNLAYKGLLTGGNIYGIDVADPWRWALAPRPIVFTVNPAINNVGVTMTQQSYNITFSTPPKDPYGNNISVQEWWIGSIGNREEWFRITQHVAGALTAQIEVPYTEATITVTNCKIAQLDYDLVDNSVIVDDYNRYIDFTEAAGAPLVATLTKGIYTPDAYVAMVNAAMIAAGTLTYTSSWNAVTRLFTWQASGVFNLQNATGPNATVNACEAMGLDVLDYTGATSYKAAYPLNAITRLTAPMLLYRKPNTPWRNPKNEGKVYEISYNTFVREYPLTMLVPGTPDKFCVTNESRTGIVSVRLNSYFDPSAPPTKVEINYIPKRQALQYNTASIPVVPEEHRKYLVDAAAAMLMHDKSDSKRTEREVIARAGLQALQHSNRKEASLAGINYGKLVPRYGMTQKRWWWQIT